VQVPHSYLAEGTGAYADLAQFVERLLPHHGRGGDVHQEQEPRLASPVGAQDRQDEPGLGGPVGGGVFVQNARYGADGRPVPLERP
jgi:hypothetical protein